MTRAEMDGETAPELVTTHTRMILGHSTYEIRFGGEMSDRGAIEATSSPPAATFLLHRTLGPDTGRTIPCIYQLVGDRLRICFGLDGTIPTAFSTSPGARRYLAVYRRIVTT